MSKSWLNVSRTISRISSRLSSSQFDHSPRLVGQCADESSVASAQPRSAMSRALSFSPSQNSCARWMIPFLCSSSVMGH